MMMNDDDMASKDMKYIIKIRMQETISIIMKCRAPLHVVYDLSALVLEFKLVLSTVAIRCFSILE
jgi:hypothetical protein